MVLFGAGHALPYSSVQHEGAHLQQRYATNVDKKLDTHPKYGKILMEYL